MNRTTETQLKAQLKQLPPIKNGSWGFYETSEGRRLGVYYENGRFNPATAFLTKNEMWNFLFWLNKILQIIKESGDKNNE